MVLENDTRGWVMAGVSGIACVVGASIICVDLAVRCFPGKRNFRIQDSNAFLSSSLSLSFGVMLYSALYSMLPSAKDYLIRGGFSAKGASWTLIACFMGGVIGIQLVSRILHHFIPSHVVGCEHSHDEEAAKHADPSGHSRDPEERGHGSHSYASDDRSDETPLLSRNDDDYKSKRKALSRMKPSETGQGSETSVGDVPGTRRSSLLPARLTKRMSSFISGEKAHCDQLGPCRGYTDPCGKECFKAISRPISRQAPYGSTIERIPRLSKSRSFSDGMRALDEGRERPESSSLVRTSTRSHSSTYSDGDGSDAHKPANATTHHHHVHSNAFLSIGLQTSIAIALHKLPEGFITYATNHANPKLGFAVFMALFIHNITEGFALALPLYLAINSRLKAMLWSAILGGASQPLGAGVAALWLRAASSHHMMPTEGLYGGMFAVTSGIMTSVALQLFSESLGLTHNRNLCIAFAFLGIGILGISNALTA